MFYHSFNIFNITPIFFLNHWPVQQSIVHFFHLAYKQFGIAYKVVYQFIPIVFIRYFGHDKAILVFYSNQSAIKNLQ